MASIHRHLRHRGHLLAAVASDGRKLPRHTPVAVACVRVANLLPLDCRVDTTYRHRRGLEWLADSGGVAEAANWRQGPD